MQDSLGREAKQRPPSRDSRYRGVKSSGSQMVDRGRPFSGARDAVAQTQPPPRAGVWGWVVCGTGPGPRAQAGPGGGPRGVCCEHNCRVMSSPPPPTWLVTIPPSPSPWTLKGVVFKHVP